MSTLNLQHFIATGNALAVREERVPTYLYSDLMGLEVPKALDEYLTRLEKYLEGIRLFGQQMHRKEDGYGERTYHFKDLEELINVLRSVGLSKSYQEFMKDFPESDGWGYPITTVVKSPKEENGEHDKYFRSTTLEGKLFDEIYEGIKVGTYTGLDCVDFSGIIHRNCQLMRISDLHPDTTKHEMALGPDGKTFLPNVIEVPGVRSDLYVIITPECNEKGWTTVPGSAESEAGPQSTLQASPYLRTVLGFVTMRIARTGEIKTRFKNGTSLLTSQCPMHIDYNHYDNVLRDMTFIVRNTNVPQVIVKSLTLLFRQAFNSTEHQQYFEQMVATIISPPEEGDGIANVYKGWQRLTGQHHHFTPILEEAVRIHKMRPRVIDDKGGVAGADQQFILTVVMDVNFKYRWAVLEEFEAVMNPDGFISGKSSIISANPNPYYIHTLNPETKEWEKEPCTKYLLVVDINHRYFARNEKPFDLIDVNELGSPDVKPITNLYHNVKAQHEAMVESLKK